MSGWHKTSRHARGYGSAWDKLRAIILTRDMHLCQSCLRNGRPTMARFVDHIKPKAQGGTDDHENLQAICGDCHDAKTQAEAAQGHGRKPRHSTGLDGWPETPKSWPHSVSRSIGYKR